MKNSNKSMRTGFLLLIGLGIGTTALAEDEVSGNLDLSLQITEVNQEMQQYRQEALLEMQSDVQNEISNMIVANRDLIESQMAEADEMLHPGKQALNLAECDPDLASQ